MVTFVLFGSAMVLLLDESVPTATRPAILMHARPAATGRYIPTLAACPSDNLSPSRDGPLGRHRSREDSLLPELLRVVRPEHAAPLRLGGPGLGFARKEIRHRRAADRRSQGALPRALQIPRRDRDRVPYRQVERQDFGGEPRGAERRRARGRRLRDPRLGAEKAGRSGPPQGD